MSGARPDLFILAGEASGDRLGASLLRALRPHADVHAWGVGGDEMLAAGLEPLFHSEKIAVMGFADVMARLPILLWRVERVVQAILRQKPDTVLLIDAQVFSMLVAKKLRRRGYRRPIILYVAPSVWAWKPERATAIEPLYDEVLALLPFEPRVMAELLGPATVFVGHPATEDPRLAPLDASPASGRIALFPGSRQGELRRHLPVLANAAGRLAALPEVEGFVLPTLPRLADRLAQEVASWPVPVEIVVDADARRKALQSCVVAIATAGTTTLELGLLGLPHVDIYVPDRLQMRAYEKAGKPLIDLVNIVLGEKTVPELEPGPEYGVRIAEAVANLIKDAPAREAQRLAFARFRKSMQQGEAADNKEDAALRVLFYLNRDGNPA